MGELYDPSTGYCYSQAPYTKKEDKYNNGVIVNPPCNLQRFGRDAGWPVLLEVPNITLPEEERGLLAAYSDDVVRKLVSWKLALRSTLYSLANLHEPSLNLNYMNVETDEQVLGTYNDLFKTYDMKAGIPPGVFALAIAQLTAASQLPEPPDCNSRLRTDLLEH